MINPTSWLYWINNTVATAGLPPPQRDTAIDNDMPKQKADTFLLRDYAMGASPLNFSSDGVLQVPITEGVRETGASNVTTTGSGSGTAAPAVAGQDGLDLRLVAIAAAAVLGYWVLTR